MHFRTAASFAAVRPGMCLLDNVSGCYAALHAGCFRGREHPVIEGRQQQSVIDRAVWLGPNVPLDEVGRFRLIARQQALIVAMLGG